MMSRLRTAVLGAFACDATLCALVAWDQDVSAPTLLLWTLAVAGALAIGEGLEGTFAVLDPDHRGRMTVFLGSLQLSVLVLALIVAAVKPSPDLLRFIANVLAGYFLLVLALVRLAPHPRAVLGHGFALTVLAGLQGGPVGAWATLSSFSLAAFFLGVDHHARLFAAFRVDPTDQGALVLRRTAAVVLPATLGFGAFLALSPLGPGRSSAFGIEGRQKREMDRSALRAVIVTVLAGTGAVYFAGRLLVRSSKGEAAPLEGVEPLKGEVRRIAADDAVTSHVDYPGTRGRVIKAYLRLLGGAARFGFPRRPDETPQEFAAALGEPRAPLAQVTDAFVRARYGPSAPAEHEVEIAERQADRAIEYLRQSPPKPRAARAEGRSG
jgi:fluoride ion exporter CrcB/FEX